MGVEQSKTNKELSGNLQDISVEINTKFVEAALFLQREEISQEIKYVWKGVFSKGTVMTVALFYIFLKKNPDYLNKIGLKYIKDNGIFLKKYNGEYSSESRRIIDSFKKSLKYQGVLETYMTYYFSGKSHRSRDDGWLFMDSDVFVKWFLRFHPKIIVKLSEEDREKAQELVNMWDNGVATKNAYHIGYQRRDIDSFKEDGVKFFR